MTNEELLSELEKTLSKKRFAHTVGVAETAKVLAARFGADEEKAYIAGLLHDCAKDMEHTEQKNLCEKHNDFFDGVTKRENKLWHAYAGAYLAQEKYGQTDPEILDAIYYHTTGKEDMSMLLKVIFLADFIEPGRSGYEGLDKVREAAEHDIDLAIIMAIEQSIKYIIKKGRLMHLDTLKARNYLIGIREEKA